MTSAMAFRWSQETVFNSSLSRNTTGIGEFGTICELSYSAVEDLENVCVARNQPANLDADLSDKSRIVA